MDNSDKNDSLQEIRKLSNLRLCLESFAAKETTVRARTDKAVSENLRATLDKLAKITAKEDFAAFDAEDHNLHEQIVRLADVPQLAQIWHTVWAALAAFHRVSLRQYWNLRLLFEEHEYLVEAICSGDVNAADDAIKNHLEAVWYRIYDHHGGSIQQGEPLQRASAYLSLHLNRSLQLEAVAKDVAFVSAGHLSRLFKQRYGLSFQGYLQKVRLEKAAELLIDTKLPISRLARRVGYRDLSRFCEHFKRSFGTSPMQYRKAAQKKTQPQL